MKRRAAQPPRGPYTTPLRQLRRRLTFVFTVLTGTVLTVFLALGGEVVDTGVSVLKKE